MPPRVFPICLYREATHLQCLESRCALFRNSLKIAVEAACLHIWLYYAIYLNYVVVSRQFFSA
jgi:hypothetical protein